MKSQGCINNNSNIPTDAILFKLPETNLTSQHRQYLINSGISEEVLNMGGYISLSSKDFNNSRWEGIYVPKSEQEGIAFAWPLSNGEMAWQYRTDSPNTQYKYRLPAKTPFRGSILRDENPESPVLIVEGTKQSRVAMSWLKNYAIIGIPGCEAWKTKGKPDDILNITKNRSVFICLDADAETNPKVKRAQERLKTVLHNIGAASISLVKVPGGGKTGLDDYVSKFPEHNREQAILSLISQSIVVDSKTSSTSSNIISIQKNKDMRVDCDIFDLGDLKGPRAYNKFLYLLQERYIWSVDKEGNLLKYDPKKVIHENFNERLANLCSRHYGDDYHTGVYRHVRDTLISRIIDEKGYLPDAKPGIAPFENGVLDLETGVFYDVANNSEFIASFNLQKTLPGKYDPNIINRKVVRDIQAIVGEEKTDAVLLMISEALDVHAAPKWSGMFWGEKGCGKSTMLDIFAWLIGEENVHYFRFNDLIHNKFEQAEFRGKWGGVCHEISTNTDAKDLTAYKEITTNRVLSGDKKYGEKMQFKNQSLNMLACNQPPNPGDDDSYFERTAAIKCVTKFRDEKTERRDIVAEYSEDDYSGLINALLEVRMNYLAKVGRNFITVKDIMTEAERTEFMEASRGIAPELHTTLTQFFSDGVNIVPVEEISRECAVKTDIWGHLQKFCASNKSLRPSKKAFDEYLDNLELQGRVKTKKLKIPGVTEGTFYYNIRIIPITTELTIDQEPQQHMTALERAAYKQQHEMLNNKLDSLQDVGNSNENSYLPE